MYVCRLDSTLLLVWRPRLSPCLGRHTYTLVQKFHSQAALLLSSSQERELQQCTFDMCNNQALSYKVGIAIGRAEVGLTNASLSCVLPRDLCHLHTWCESHCVTRQPQFGMSNEYWLTYYPNSNRSLNFKIKNRFSNVPSDNVVWTVAPPFPTK